MIDRLNKTSLCSIVFLDIIDYSKKSVSEQIDEKAFFNELINEAIQNVAQADRIILDTGDGAVIALMGEPEEALFISLSIRDRILHQNKSGGPSLKVRIGINLGSVRVVNDINNHPNIIGDGINVAQRIMSFAGENEILVSRSYYEATSRLTKELSGMFTYSGVRQDKHIREHEVYLIKPRVSGEIKVADNVFGSRTDQKVAINEFKNRLKSSKIVLTASFGLVAGLFVWYFFSMQSKPSSAVQPLASKMPIKDTPALDISDKVSDKKQSNNDRHKTKSARTSSSNHKKHPTEAKPIQVKETNTNQLRKNLVAKDCSQAEIAIGQCRN